MPTNIEEKGVLLAIALVTIIVFMFIISPEPKTQAFLDNQTENNDPQIEPQLNLAVYLVFNQQNSYTVKNRDGVVELQTEDASNAINYALNSVADQGGRVFLTTGNYIIQDTIKIHGNTILEGEAIDDVNSAGFGTRLIAGKNLTGSILSNANPNTGDSVITLKTLSFNGARSNKELKIGSNGILFTKTTRCRILDVTVYNCKDSGIVFDGNQETFEAIIERVSSRGNNNAGLYMKTQSDFHISNSEFGSNQGDGILLASCSSGSISETNVFLNQRTGIQLYNTMNMRLSSNRANHNGYSGIEIVSTSQNRTEYNTIVSNICYDNGQQSNSQAGIKINSRGASVSNCLINSNTCYDDQLVKTQDFGILEQPGATANIISQNLCVNNKIQDIKLSESTP